ncbi:hypothetical protein ACFSE1_01180 [Rhizobium helianthi]|uniref:Helix-turn-helix domain-containing protein n=1 Tax=Rhizobium helianthi TaxID=1132695 RepID=A0ABW4LY04_9HYPH
MEAPKNPPMKIEPRLLSRPQAAALCGIAPSTFSMWVRTHIMPPPIPGTRRWDKAAIEDKLNAIGGLAVNHNQEDEFDRWEREHGKFGSGSFSPPRTPNPNPKRGTVDSWRARKAERDKLKPRHGLNAVQLRVLAFMIDHPDCTTTDVIPDAGVKTMEYIAKVGCVRAGGKDADGRQHWHITDEGRTEIYRERTWRTRS